jgi:hypothetical protein
MPVTPSHALLSGALTTGLFATGLALGVSALTTPALAFCDDGRVMGGCVTSIEEFPLAGLAVSHRGRNAARIAFLRRIGGCPSAGC